MMKVIKEVKKEEMSKAMSKEARSNYSACSSDCPRCRVSDG